MKQLFICMLCLTIGNYTVHAQKDSKTFNFKKGEVLDFILLTMKPNSSALFEKYREVIYPIGFEFGYEPQQGFRTKELILGNHLPSVFVFGKWPSKEKRHGFLETIVSRVPDFHQRRRDLFSYFTFAFFEIQENKTISLQKNKVNSITAFWKTDKQDIEKFVSKWKEQAKISGGSSIVQLQNGYSPAGYNYNPDILIITEWENETAFSKFTEKHPLSFYKELKNVHQFVIE
ncbi:hypothetical protein [Aquimarina addita]